MSGNKLRGPKTTQVGFGFVGVVVVIITTPRLIATDMVIIFFRPTCADSKR